ncbi:MAG: Hsp20/alpha crystallin family protein [Phycisphaerae bacterium]
MSRWETDPSGPLHQLRREVDRVLDSFVGGVGCRSLFVGRNEPPVNVWQDAEHVHVEVELPGLSIQDVEVHITESELSIKARRPEVDSESVTYHRQERATGELVRHVKLPVLVDAERAEAVLKDGLLKVTMPKSETVRPRRISVSGD